MKSSNETRLGTEKLGKLFFGMGIPLVVAQLVSLLYNMVDRMYIGHIPGIGTDALTGVGLTTTVILIVLAFCSLVSGGATPLAAIALGQGDEKKARSYLNHGLIMLLCFSMLMTVVMLILKEPILYAIGASKNTFGYADDYLTIYLLGVVFLMISGGLNAFITAHGKSRMAMCSTLIGAVVNILLDPLLIYTFDLGVKGAAIATVIAEFCSAAWVMWILLHPAAVLHFDFQKFHWDWKIIGGIVGLGISPFIMQSTEALVAFTINHGLLAYGGDIYVAALTVMQSTMALITTPINGFTGGVQPILSYNFGARNNERVLKAYRLLFAIVVIYSVVIAATEMIFPTLFAGIFTEDALLIEKVGEILPIYVSGMLLFGLQMSSQPTYMALGKGKMAIIFACLRKIILLVPLSLILPALTGDVMGIYWAEPIADALSALSCAIVLWLNLKKFLEKGPTT